MSGLNKEDPMCTVMRMMNVLAGMGLEKPRNHRIAMMEVFAKRWYYESRSDT